MAARAYEVSRRIDAPAAAVWALLTDAGSYAGWNPAVVRIDGTIEQGGTIRLVSTASPKRTFKLRVDEVRAPYHLVWSDGMPLGLFTGRRTFTLRDRGDGGTDFAMVERFGGPLAGLITRAIPDLTESFNAFADGLKQAAEAAEG
ncbi:MAG: SRPBCC domain-containing protein [Acidimicrobiales bacterium]